MPTPDYSTWLTKSVAAETIGVSTKTVEQLAKDGKLDQARYRRPDGGPELAVFHPDDVARIAAERQPARSAFVLPAATTPANGNGHHTRTSTALMPAQPSAAGPEAAVAFLRAMLTGILSQSSESSEKSQRSPALYVTVKEAAAILGLPQVDVRALIHDGDLPHRLTGRGAIRIRRRDLEAF